ncbi:MAG TPA: preprotein translocase subunit SecY, partial [Clostridiales bacterium]|nr:preprotein translocase subunit SecY [Clostridiales bacterium]
MFETMRNAWKIPDLRKRILFTLMMIVVYRFGSVIPVPFINREVV